MRSDRGFVGAVIAVLLVALSWFAIDRVMPPPAVASDAPVTVFSAERAQKHVEVISEKPHPTGSAAAAEVREYIVAQLEAMGLAPEVQSSVGAAGNLGGFAMANVQNVIATIEGTASTGTVYLVTHYDSVTWSHGANDDGVGVGTLLETARAVLAGATPQNDVVLLFTDAEEMCLCGAEAYVNDNPDATGVVLNFEARGSSGPAIMFETTLGNAGVVDVYADAAPYPVATSFAVEVYRLLPNDTDFSPFRDAGRFTGLNTAYIDGSAAYHSQQDSMEHFSGATLQHHGSNALAVASGFAGTDLTVLTQPSATDATYFPALGTLVVYPGTWVWVIAVLALLIVFGACVFASQRGVVSGGKLVVGIIVGLVLLVLPALAAMGLWQVLLALRPGYASFADPWQPGWYRVAVAAIVFAVVAAVYALLRRRVGAEALALGGLFWLAILGIALAAFAPGGSYLAAIPALIGGLAAVARIATAHRVIGVIAAFIAAAVGLVILAPTVVLFFPALGLATAAAPAVLATLALFTVLPALELLMPSVADGPAAVADTGARRRFKAALPALIAVCVAVVAVGIGLVVDRFDARHPIPVAMTYALDTDTGEAFWVRGGGDPTGWSAALVNEQRDLSEQLPLVSASATVGDADVVDLEAPEVEVLSERATAAGREVELRVSQRSDAQWVRLAIENVDVVAASVAGREVTIGDGEAFSVLFYTAPADGLNVTLELRGNAPVELQVADGSPGLDAIPGFAPRPEGVSIANARAADMVMVVATRTF